MTSTPTSTPFTIGITTSRSFEDAVERTRSELTAEGFGVLCEIDIQSTLKAKLDADLEPYVILGACMPPAALEALSTEPQIGALLPCNVIVYVRDGVTYVSAIDAERMLSIVEHPGLVPLAQDIKARLARVVERVGMAA